MIIKKYIFLFGLNVALIQALFCMEDNSRLEEAYLVDDDPVTMRLELAVMGEYLSKQTEAKAKSDARVKALLDAVSERNLGRNDLSYYGYNQIISIIEPRLNSQNYDDRKLLYKFNNVNQNSPEYWCCCSFPDAPKHQAVRNQDRLETIDLIHVILSNEYKIRQACDSQAVPLVDGVSLFDGQVKHFRIDR